MKLENSMLGDQPIADTLLPREYLEELDLALARIDEAFLRHRKNVRDPYTLQAGDPTIQLSKLFDKLKALRKEYPEECEGCGSKDLPCFCIDY